MPWTDHLSDTGAWQQWLMATGSWPRCADRIQGQTGQSDAPQKALRADEAGPALGEAAVDSTL